MVLELTWFFGTCLLRHSRSDSVAKDNPRVKWLLYCHYFKTVGQVSHNLGCSSEDRGTKINNSSFLASIQASTDMNERIKGQSSCGQSPFSMRNKYD